MTIYTHRATILVPLALVTSGAAQKLGRAFDPDNGGAKNFDTIRAGTVAGIATHAVCDCWVRAETSQLMANLISTDAATMRTWCVQQYLQRFPTEAPPTTME